MQVDSKRAVYCLFQVGVTVGYPYENSSLYSPDPWSMDIFHLDVRCSVRVLYPETTPDNNAELRASVSSLPVRATDDDTSTFLTASSYDFRFMVHFKAHRMIHQSLDT